MGKLADFVERLFDFLQDIVEWTGETAKTAGTKIISKMKPVSRVSKKVLKRTNRTTMRVIRNF